MPDRRWLHLHYPGGRSDGPGRQGGALAFGGHTQRAWRQVRFVQQRGRGTDSTGLYIEWPSPTVPAIDLTSTGINLHSGDIFNAQLTYNGATLTVVITDTVTNATATQTYTVNIPAIVGGPTAYVGFTGGSGGATAIQQILNWSYSPIPATGPAFPNGFSTPAVADDSERRGRAEWDQAALDRRQPE